MAAATYTPTTSASGVSKIWRKVQGELAEGFGFEVPEWDAMGSLKNYKIDVSAREITVPLDINEGYGVASIDEGALEARPSSPNAEELTLTYQLFSKRFTASVTAQILDQYHRAAELKRQIVFQGSHAVRDMARHWADYMYGHTTARLARTSTDATQSSGTYTLEYGYGESSISNAALIADKFKVGDAVALERSGNLVSNAIGIITAVTAATPSIAVTWNGSVNSDANDYVVKANSLGNTVIGDTDYNKGMTGLLDMALTASVHSLSSSTVPNWSAAYSKTSSARWSGIEFHRGKQEIMFQGGGKADRVFIAPGVKRDVLALQQAALRFNDQFALELDGDIKGQGVKFFESKRVPSSWVFMFDSNAIRKLDVMPKPDGSGLSWGDGTRLTDYSGYVFPVSMLTALVCTNRKRLAYWSGATEQ